MSVTEELEKAWDLLAAGDVRSLLRHLHSAGDTLPPDEVARLAEGAARLAEFDDLAQAAAAVAEAGDHSGAEDARLLHAFGYACIDHGLSDLAVRPLARALELAPDSAAVLSELVVALEHDRQYARAVAVLEAHEPVMGWLNRFQYVYNAIMAGALDKAAEGFGRLPEPEDAAWIPARQKVRRMLARADIARAVTPLNHQDLRGWHYVLTGGVLESLSPYGFDAGMTGRWAYVGDSIDGCAAALQRLKLILEASGAVPEAVALLPDRSSQILGAAAAAALSLPAVDFDPGKPAAQPRRRLRPDPDRPGRRRSSPPACPRPDPARAGNLLDRSAPRHRRRQRPARPGRDGAVGRAAGPPRGRRCRPGPGRRPADRGHRRRDRPHHAAAGPW